MVQTNICVCDFHIVCHLLSWASGGGATNTLYVGTSHNRKHALQDVEFLPSQPH